MRVERGTIFSSLSPWDLGLGTWDLGLGTYLEITWNLEIPPHSLVGKCQYEKLAVDISDKLWAFHDTEMYIDPGPSQMSVPMAGFGLVDTIGNRANGRRPRLPPLPKFPSSFFLLIHPIPQHPSHPSQPSQPSQPSRLSRVI